MTTRRTFLQVERRRCRGPGVRRLAAPAPTTRRASPTPRSRSARPMPYSGPASAYGVIGKTEAAYFKMINEQGGVNGRKINLISLDDGYSPPKTVEQTRRLVEQEAASPSFSTASAPRRNAAVREYLNENKVPQLFVATGAAMFADSRALSLDDRVSAELSDRGAHFRQAHSGDQAGRQDRRALSERRLRQGLS